jgi:hypothetical protein
MPSAAIPAEDEIDIWNSIARSKSKLIEKQVVCIGNCKPLNNLVKALGVDLNVGHSLQYQYKDIIEDGELLARIGYYTMATDSSHSLLEFAINKDNVADSIVDLTYIRYFLT